MEDIIPCTITLRWRRLMQEPIAYLTEKTCLVRRAKNLVNAVRRIISIPIPPLREYTKQTCSQWSHEKELKALHQSNSPIAMRVSHLRQVFRFLSCEHHYPEISWYDSLIDGVQSL
jgi:hypothetical protein